MKTIIIISINLLMCWAHASGQTVDSPKVEFPVYDGSNGQLENYLLAQFLLREKQVAKLCDTSLGMIEFYVGENGNVHSITMPANFPEEIKGILSSIVRTTNWIPMKVNGKDVESLPMVLPVLIAIEAGCPDSYIKKGFGMDIDFRNMLATFRNEQYRNCILLRPITYVLSKGFQDLNPAKK